jgi:hypothetical protein
MSIEAKKLKIYQRIDEPESYIDFVPEMVDDLEVYSVVNSKGQHCGYITPELLDLLTIEENGESFLNQSFEIRVANDWGEKNKLYQKIILDAPQGKNRDYFPLLTFAPTEYVGDEPKKALKLTVNKEFKIASNGGGLEINFNDNLAEIDKFYFYSTHLAKTTLNMDLAEHKAKSIFINELRGSNKNKGDVVFNFASTRDYPPLISLINSKIEPAEDVLNKRFVYPVFKIGGDTFNVTQSEVKLPSTLLSKDSSPLFEIRTLKGDISLMDSEITMFETKNKEGNFLEVKKDINLTKANLSINETATINGAFESSSIPKQSNKTGISITKSTFQGDLMFKPRNKNKCHFAISNSTLDNGGKKILLRSEVFFVDVNLKNNPQKDITFADVEIKYCNLFNTNSLNCCKITKTHVENFTFINDSKDDMVFSYGPEIQGLARTEEEKKITHLLKNTEVELSGSDYFRDRSSGPLSITNCVIKGKTTIDSFCKENNRKVDGSYPVSINNSILKKAELVLDRNINSDVSSVEINSSEIIGTFIAHDLEKVDSSLIHNSLVSNVLSLKNSVLDSDEIKADEIVEIDSYNSNSKNTTSENMKTISRTSNEDMELL